MRTPAEPQAVPAPLGVMPASLHTATPAEGQALAWRLASGLLSTLPAAGSMPEYLRTSSNRPAPEVVAAIYFHAISLANSGWPARG
ncbi:MAG TPA: hypothetical protein VIM71_12280 [Lacunisphaera sp.]